MGDAGVHLSGRRRNTQAWLVLTAALLKPPLTVLQRSVGVHYVGDGQRHPGAEDRTVTASAVLQVIRLDLPLPVAVGEPVGEPVQRLWKLAGIKGGGWRAMLLMSQTSPQKQLLTSTLNWPRQSLSKQEETAVPPSSPTLPPAVGTRDHTATFTSAPSRLGCMH